MSSISTPHPSEASESPDHKKSENLSQEAKSNHQQLNEDLSLVKKDSINQFIPAEKEAIGNIEYKYKSNDKPCDLINDKSETSDTKNLTHISTGKFSNKTVFPYLSKFLIPTMSQNCMYMI